MKKNQSAPKSIFFPVSVAVIVLLICINLAILYYLQVLSKAVISLRKEDILLKGTNQTMQTSLASYNEYKDRIASLNQVFPDEESIPDFISVLEERVKKAAAEYTFRFSSLTPLAEQDRLYLLLNLTVKTDLTKLLSFLQDIETMPYMMHVLSISSKNSQGLTGEAEVMISMKLYVQKPFSAK